MVRTLILASLLFGCGRFEPAKRTSPTKFEIEDPDFLVYIQKFEKASETRLLTVVANIVVEYGDLEEGVIGLCTIEPRATPLITIDRTYWATASNIEKETLMFHELGHCRLKRKHKSEEDNNQPVSIMYPRSIWNYYQYRPPVYQDELFSITDDWFTLIDKNEEFDCVYLLGG